MIIHTASGDRKELPFGSIVRGIRARSITLTENELRTTTMDIDECMRYIREQLKPCTGRILYKEDEVGVFEYDWYVDFEEDDG